MEVNPPSAPSAGEEEIRAALNTHWHASAAGDLETEHNISDDNAVCDYPQSGERTLGRSNLQAVRSHHPGKPSGFNVKRILGSAGACGVSGSPDPCMSHSAKVRGVGVEGEGRDQSAGERQPGSDHQDGAEAADEGCADGGLD